MLLGRDLWSNRLIRRANIEDTNRIAEIHVFGWRSAYRGIISDEYLLGKASVARRTMAFSKAIEEDSEETYVFDENGLVKAFMTIGNCRNEDKKDAFELWGIYVEPMLKGQGIGAQLIDYCEKQAIERGYKEIVLWVFKENISARRFYEKMGYTFDGKEENIEYFGVAEIRYAKSLHK